VAAEGAKASFVADTRSYEMGSDHDVYQESSFRIPTIYLRDCPDVFIHTNNDLPSNIDATKIKRSVFIATASGYFLARAGGREAAPLAEEVFARPLAALTNVSPRAPALETSGALDAAREPRHLIARAVDTD